MILTINRLIMSATIDSCSYAQSDESAFNPIKPVSPVQSQGQHDISGLVHQIVTKDFGYTGLEPYKLTLKDNHMVLEIWTNQGQTTKSKQKKTRLECNDGVWEKTSGTTVTPLTDARQTTQRLRNTMSRVALAYGQVEKPSQPTGSSSVLVEGEKGNSVNTCTHPDCSDQIRALGLQMNQLDQRHAALEKLLASKQPLTTDETAQSISTLNTTIGTLTEQINALQKDIQRLYAQNTSLKGLK